MKKSLVLATALVFIAVAPSANAGDIIGPIKKGISALRGDGLMKGLMGAGKSLSNLFKGGVKRVKDVLGGIRTKVFGAFGHMAARLKGMGKRIADGVKNYTTTFAKNLKDGLRGLVGQGLKLGKGLWGKVTGGFMAAAQKAQESALAFFQKVGGGAIKNLSGIHTSFTNFLKGGFEKLRGLAAGTVKKIKLPTFKGTGIKEAFGKIKGLFGK